MTVKLHCLADICLIPIGTSSPSGSNFVAKITNHIRENTKVKSTLHSAGTTLDGEWDDVMELIGELHLLAHEKLGIIRLHSDIRVGTRIDKFQTARDKVDVVERKIKSI